MSSSEPQTSLNQHPQQEQLSLPPDADGFLPPKKRKPSADSSHASGQSILKKIKVTDADTACSSNNTSATTAQRKASADSSCSNADILAAAAAKRKASADSSEDWTKRITTVDNSTLEKSRKGSLDSYHDDIPLAPLGRKFSVSSDEASSRRKGSDDANAGATGILRKSSLGSENDLFLNSSSFSRRKWSLDSTHSHDLLHPPRRRKASVDSEDALMALGSVASTTLSDEMAKQQQKKSNNTTTSIHNNTTSTSALDHLDALGDEKESATGGSGGTLASGNQRLLMEALMMTSSSNRRARDRLESWGGMSDLSVAGEFASSEAAAAFAASALQETGIMEDVAMAAAGTDPSSGDTFALEFSEEGHSNRAAGGTNAAKVPSKISVRPAERERKMSADQESNASSSLNLEPVVVAAPDIQAFVQAAMLTMGSHIAELAGQVEDAATLGEVASLSSDALRKDAGLTVDMDDASFTSPLIGAVTESDLALIKMGKNGGARPRSHSTSSLSIAPVDYAAVAAAVEAGESAAGHLGLKSDQSAKKPLHASSSAPLPDPPSSLTDRELEERRARARAAAGYVPPPEGTVTTPAPRPPIKKRPKIPTPPKVPSNAGIYSSSHKKMSSRKPLPTAATRAAATPKISNARGGPLPPATPSAAHLSATSAAYATSSASKATSQKWDDMFECLLQFVRDRKEEELREASDGNKKKWKWDGNVPTNYKTADGKALGRWINNQRSAKTKGTLKEDREEKLVSTGLRWCVLVTNSWDDMMNELRIYVKEQTKNGGEWDGNVPTNYRIKRDGQRTTAKQSASADDDKNLGRWINRQRSLYQSGKLRKDRQQQLEKIGLKWSVLATTSWESMYQTLCEYVKERKALDANNAWDGNVPAKYETKDDPPKALGRWINRQRSAHTKNRLKKEFVDKLTEVGLKWAVHERRATPALVTSSSPDETETNGD